MSLAGDGDSSDCDGDDGKPFNDDMFDEVEVSE
eukprot:CAMPEP_0201593738 /NCGR_PEP_ID=MMETSP0190_2-20130828/191255_1 /ASSEMBLY_ACC=CAM_ASM_000263 /TAXON_ID=37353 /ORGANISM="Rosalina sp." /LENGTH=32 /DNA_ID= /DNA_START= /DNA_END= /DNA_ORIENTATION=